MRRPSAVRIGMFCRFGSLLDKPPGHRDRLRVVGVHAAGRRVDHQRQLVGVGALQLRQAAVLEQLAGQRVVGGELLQHVLVGRRRAARGLPADRQAELAEQDLADLLRAAEVERLAGDVEGLLLERGHALGELLALRREQGRVDQHAGALDPRRAPPRSASRSGGRRRRGPASASMPRPERLVHVQRHVGVLARVVGGALDLDLRERDLARRPCRRRPRRSARCGRDGETRGSRACAPCAPRRRSSRASCRGA